MRLAASLSRRQAGTGGSGRSFIIFVVRGRRPRYASRRHLAVARPEQEVPADPSLHRPSFEHPRPEQVVPVASSLHHPRHIAKYELPRLEQEVPVDPSYAVRGQGVTRPKYVSRRDAAEL